MTDLLSITDQTKNGVQILSLIGRLDSTNALDFEKKIMEQLDKHSIVLVDFSQLSFISSAGLRVILMAAKQAKQRSIQFALCGMDDNIRGVFEVSGFLRILQVYSNIDEAIAALC